VLNLVDGLDLGLDRGLLVGDRPGRRREDDLAGGSGCLREPLGESVDPAL